MEYAIVFVFFFVGMAIGGWLNRRIHNSDGYGWQPMSTVPKDGTVFIAHTPLGISRCKWDIVDWGEHPLDSGVEWWYDPDELLYFEDGPNDAPTKWMREPK